MKLTTKQAIEYILKEDKQANKYRLAKAFGCSNTSIHNYIKGVAVINEDVYQKLVEIYPEIEVIDVYYKPQYKLGLTKH